MTDVFSVKWITAIHRSHISQDVDIVSWTECPAQGEAISTPVTYFFDSRPLEVALRSLGGHVVVGRGVGGRVFALVVRVTIAFFYGSKHSPINTDRQQNTEQGLFSPTPVNPRMFLQSPSCPPPPTHPLLYLWGYPVLGLHGNCDWGIRHHLWNHPSRSCSLRSEVPSSLKCGTALQTEDSTRACSEPGGLLWLKKGGVPSALKLSSKRDGKPTLEKNSHPISLFRRQFNATSGIQTDEQRGVNVTAFHLAGFPHEKLILQVACF